MTKLPSPPPPSTGLHHSAAAHARDGEAARGRHACGAGAARAGGAPHRLDRPPLLGGPPRDARGLTHPPWLSPCRWWARRVSCIAVCNFKSAHHGTMIISCLSARWCTTVANGTDPLVALLGNSSDPPVWYALGVAVSDVAAIASHRYSRQGTYWCDVYVGITTKATKKTLLTKGQSQAYPRAPAFPWPCCGHHHSICPQCILHTGQCWRRKRSSSQQCKGRCWRS